jgi:hypothetical protein
VVHIATGEPLTATDGATLHIAALIMDAPRRHVAIRTVALFGNEYWHTALHCRLLA